VLSDPQLPTLWNPQELFFHLAVWAGVPAIVMAVAVALLGIYKSVKSWIEFGKSTIHAAGVAGGKLRSWTTRQQRALVRLLVFSVLAVVFSYMLAVIIDVEIRMWVANPNAVFSMKDVMDRVDVTPWPVAAVWTVVGVVFGISVLGIAYIADLQGVATFVTALGAVVWIAAWLVGSVMALEAIGGFLMDLFSADRSDAPPLRYVVTVAATGLLGILLARLLPKVDDAGADAFATSERSG
jgi:hypothetical protein